MHKRNTLMVFGLLMAVEVVVTLCAMAVWPERDLLVTPGIGMTAVVLMIANKHWLDPRSGAMPRAVVVRNAAIAVAIGFSFAAIFRSLR